MEDEKVPKVLALNSNQPQQQQQQQDEDKEQSKEETVHAVDLPLLDPIIGCVAQLIETSLPFGNGHVKCTIKDGNEKKQENNDDNRKTTTTTHHYYEGS